TLDQLQPVYLLRRWIMKRRVSFALFLVPALALAGFGFAQAPRPGDKGKSADKKAADKGKADREKIVAAIKKDGKLPKDRYWQHAETLRGGKTRKIPAVPLHGQNSKGGGGKSTALTTGLAATTNSSLTVVGGEGLPTGFGSGFSWDRKEEEVLLVMFINAA